MQTESDLDVQVEQFGILEGMVEFGMVEGVQVEAGMFEGIQVEPGMLEWVQVEDALE